MMSKKQKKDKSNPNNLEHEKILWKDGYELIAGIDEAGRGCMAGPVVACACIMPKNFRIERLTDSKKIKSEINDFEEKVKKHAIAWSIGEASVQEIEKINIKMASRLAMKRAVEGLSEKPEYLLIDGGEIVDLPIKQKSIIKGDFNSHSISAAAVIAKSYRDKLMERLDEETNHLYNWKENAGYVVPQHVDACEKYGITKHHRKTYAPVKRLIEEKKGSLLFTKKRNNLKCEEKE